MTKIDWFTHQHFLLPTNNVLYQYFYIHNGRNLSSSNIILQTELLVRGCSFKNYSTSSNYIFNECLLEKSKLYHLMGSPINKMRVSYLYICNTFLIYEVFCLMENYIYIINSLLKLSNNILCIGLVNVFGEIVDCRVKDEKFDDTSIKECLLKQFRKIIDNSIYLNFENFVLAIFNTDNFKVIVINRSEHNLIIVLKKTIQFRDFLSIITFLFNTFLKDG